jgi:hypothetical protein
LSGWRSKRNATPFPGPDRSIRDWGLTPVRDIQTRRNSGGPCEIAPVCKVFINFTPVTFPQLDRGTPYVGG